MRKIAKDLVNKRLPAWDLLKLLAIFFVIWGHSIAAFSSLKPLDNPLFIRLNGFHVGLFMMISGYFSSSAFQLTPLRFIRKKLYQLIYPCFAWGGMKWIIIETILIISGGCDSISIFGLLSDLYWFSDFWFLKSCFLCFCIAYFGHRLLKDRYWMPLTFIISQVIPVFSIPFMYPCFLMGITIKKNEKLMKWIISHVVILSFLFAILLFGWNQEAWNKSHGMPVDISICNIFAWSELLFFRAYRLLLGVLGGLTFISIFHNLFNKTICSTIASSLSYWGQYTLEIYIVQSFILEQTLSHFIKFDYLNPTIFNIIITPLASITVLLLCIYIICKIYQSRLLSKLLFAKETK